MKKSVLFGCLWSVCCLLMAFEPKPVNWDNAKEIQSGVKHVKLSFKEPRLMKVQILRVDLKQPGLYFYALGADKDYGKTMPDAPEYKQKIVTKRIKVVDFMKRERSAGKNMIVAVNSSGWGPWYKPFNHKYASPNRLCISGGKVLCDKAKKNFAIFAVDKNGTPFVLDELSKEDYGKYEIVASGFGTLFLAEKFCPFRPYQKVANPKMCYGISKDKRYLYLMSIDGRQEKWSMGAMLDEMGKLMLAAGAYDAVDMDGGGSVSLVYFDRKSKKPVFLNKHAGNGQRTVGNCFGICLK